MTNLIRYIDIVYIKCILSIDIRTWGIMNTAVINVKVEAGLKREAANTARELGLSLSSVVKGLLKQFVAKKAVTFERSEIPNEYMIRELKKSEEDIKKGWVSPSFINAKDAIAWLHDPHRKYVRQLQKKTVQKHK